MNIFTTRKTNNVYRSICALLILTLVFSSVLLSPSFAQSVINLPTPGVMVTQSAAYVPTLLRGMTVHLEDPFKFDFIVDNGNSKLEGEELKTESKRLVNYFLASMTVPKGDLWVNLSPVERDRIVPDALGKTELGRDLLAQDYILKQLTASLMHPEGEVGKKLWEAIYAKAEEQGISNIPADTFNKVWILPESATIYENGVTVYVVESKLKVMLDKDYLANSEQRLADSKAEDVNVQLIRNIIIPEIEKEVNQGQHFASLRQMYHSLILAKWYKQKVKNSILSKVYIDQNKVAGVKASDVIARRQSENQTDAAISNNEIASQNTLAMTTPEQIYNQYMIAYKKGVYNHIREEYDPESKQIVPKKYFSGGFKDQAMVVKRTESSKRINSSSVGKSSIVEVEIRPEEDVDEAMLGMPTGWHIKRALNEKKSDEKRLASIEVLRNRKGLEVKEIISTFDELVDKIPESTIKRNPYNKKAKTLEFLSKALKLKEEGYGFEIKYEKGNEHQIHHPAEEVTEAWGEGFVMSQHPEGHTGWESGSITYKKEAWYEPVDAFEKIEICPALSAEQLRILKMAQELYGFSNSDREYFANLWVQMPIEGEQLKIVLDRKNMKEGENFILASMLTEEERKKLLGSYSYAEIAADEENAKVAKQAIVTINSMDGGIGESLNRLKFLQNKARIEGLTEEEVNSIKMGAKGTDLGYMIKREEKEIFVSVAEAKLLQLIDIAKKNKFSKMKLQPLVNWQSKASYKDLLDKLDYFHDRLKTNSRKRTYREILESDQVGIEVLEMIEQKDLPWFEKESNSLVLKNLRKGLNYKQPGGHGQLGFLFLYNIIKDPIKENDEKHIRVFYNGDNINSRVDEYITGWMIKNNLPIVKLTTPATSIDKKGGKDGAKIIQVEGKDVLVPAQMEKADAVLANQEEEFYSAGQKNGIGEEGKQPFNTNIFYINESILSEIFEDLKKLDEYKDVKEILKIISPTLIKKPFAQKLKDKGDDRYFRPIDGAIGTVMHNLNEFFQTTTNPKVKEILSSKGLDRALFFVDIPRTLFFTPVKNPFDMLLQSYSDYYDFDLNFSLNDAEDGLVPPEIIIENSNDKEYWKEYQNFINAFGHIKLRELKSLRIEGKVKSKDARLAGKVSIINKANEEIDLNAIPELQKYKEDGVLVLKNVDIIYHEEVEGTPAYMEIVSVDNALIVKKTDNAKRIDSSEVGKSSTVEVEIRPEDGDVDAAMLGDKKGAYDPKKDRYFVEILNSARKINLKIDQHVLFKLYTLHVKALIEKDRKFALGHVPHGEIIIIDEHDRYSNGESYSRVIDNDSFSDFLKYKVGISDIYNLEKAYVGFAREGTVGDYSFNPEHYYTQYYQNFYVVPGEYDSLLKFCVLVGKSSLRKALLGKNEESTSFVKDIESIVNSGVRILGKSPFSVSLGNKEAGFLIFERLGLAYPPGIALSEDFVKTILDSSRAEQFVSFINVELERSGVDLKKSSFSIRSNPKVSAPGRYDTITNVGLESILSAIKSVAKSWNSGLSKKHRNTLKGDKYDLPIIIQEWIDGKAPKAKIYNEQEYPDPSLIKTVTNFIFGVFSTHDSDPSLIKTVTNFMSGVFSTRNPDTNEDKMFGQYILDANGEELMTLGGVGNNINDLSEINPKVYRQLIDAKIKLEDEVGPQELEFVVNQGKVYFLQTRNLNFSPQGEIAYITELLENKTIEEVKAVSRIQFLQEKLKERAVYKIKKKKEIETLAMAMASTAGDFQGHLVYRRSGSQFHGKE
ncbi:MAG: UTP--glucose-1-phosphate uridylyltransferase [Candidatus Zapsychrus exili]|nr:UTP--glucose-1-phosphate uridylyltransferase [Candidatus Zapsychrus exili]